MNVRPILRDRPSQVAAAALCAIFLASVLTPWDDHSAAHDSLAGYGVLAFFGIGILTAIYLGAFAHYPILSSAAFASAAMAAYILGAGFDYQFGLFGVHWDSYNDSGKLFGYNLGDLIDRAIIWAVFAAPVGAFFGAVGLAFGKTMFRRTSDGWRALAAWQIAAASLVIVLVTAVYYPWDPVDGSDAYIPAFLFAMALSAATAIAVGSRSPATLRSGALFGVLAIAVYNLGCFIDYELAWRGNTWSPWSHQDVLWGSHAALVALGVLMMAPALAAAGALLAWAGETITGGRFKAHGQQAAG